MAATNDPRASGFNAAEFRDAIRFAMNMGLPNRPADKATFRWNTVKTYTTSDPSGVPYNYDATPVAVISKDDVQIPVAVEFSESKTTSGETFVANFDSPSVTLTVLDRDYELIAGADMVLLGGNTYVVDYVGPPIGLFDVTVFQIYARALDES